MLILLEKLLIYVDTQKERDIFIIPTVAIGYDMILLSMYSRM